MAKKNKLICPKCGSTRTIIKKENKDARLCLDCYHNWLSADDVLPEDVKGSYKEHQDILENCALLVQKQWPDSFFIERHVGLFLTMSGNKIQVGTPGQADAYILLPVAIGSIRFHIHIETEIKSGQGKQSKKQKEWEKEINSRGGLYILVRKPEDIVSTILKKYGELIG